MDGGILAAGGLLGWLDLQAGLPNMVFFAEISSFLDDELIHEYLPNLGKRVIGLVGGLALVLMTLWIMVQGFRILTGRSREPMMALVVDALRATFIIGVALGVSAAWGPLYETLGNGTTRVVNEIMADDADGKGPYEDIDRALAIMQVALQTIDTVDSNGDLIVDKSKDRALWFAGLGLGGPAIMAAAALLLNKIGIGLLLALGPLFILSLLFEPTKPMFQKWLYYLVGTLCSMALLSVMATLALDMVIAVGMAFWVSGAAGFGGEGLTSLAMQQGGLGLLMTVLIVSAPPMAAALFQGALGHFNAYNAFAGQAPPPGTNLPPQAGGYRHTPPPVVSGREFSGDLTSSNRGVVQGGSP